MCVSGSVDTNGCFFWTLVVAVAAAAASGIAVAAVRADVANGADGGATGVALEGFGPADPSATPVAVMQQGFCTVEAAGPGCVTVLDGVTDLAADEVSKGMAFAAAVTGTGAPGGGGWQLAALIDEHVGKL